MAAPGVHLGALRHRLALEAERPAGDGGGGQGDPWADPVAVATVWGRVEPLRGGERLRALQLEERVTHRVTIRHRPGVTPAMRVRFGARLFNIRAVINRDERDRFLELLCEEGVAT